MDKQIRIVIFDDESIAREGMRRILELAPEIEVVAAAKSVDAIRTAIDDKRPDLLLLDVDWGDDGGANILPLIRAVKQARPEVGIVALSAHPECIQKAKDAGADWARNKKVDADELLSLVREAYWRRRSEPGSLPDLRAAETALERIRLRSTADDTAAHEGDVHQILSVALAPHLANGQLRVMTWDGKRKRDVMFSNRGTNRFWSRMLAWHDARQVVVEVKNTTAEKVGEDGLLQTAKYLEPGIGHLGLLVMRTPASKALWESAGRLCKNENKAVLMLSDDDLAKLIRAKALGGDPSDLIESIYEELVRGQ